MHENRETSGASREQRDRFGKAHRHNPDVYAPEESDCAIVAMNLPNKRSASFGGGGGAKGAGQGEAADSFARGGLRAASHVCQELPHYAPCREGLASCAPISEAGAVCGKSARTDLRGGRPAMAVPTATSAGINRHIVGDERAPPERRSDSTLTSSLAPVAVRGQAKRRQRHWWAGY